MALRVGSDLAGLIEPNSRRSLAKLRIWRLKTGQIWPEYEMQECNSYSLTGPKGANREGDFSRWSKTIGHGSNN
jgi:hypothetical protein